MLRALVSTAFTPRRIAALEPRIREATRDLLDQAGDRFDLVDALVEPLPMTVISEPLGLSETDRASIAGWMAAIADAGGDTADPFSDPEVMQAVLAVFGPFVAHLAGVAAARRAAPGDDLISALVLTEVAGEVLDDQAADTFAMGLFMAGHATTTGLLGNVIRTLDEQPQLWDVLRADRGLIPPFLEEVLRLRPTLPRLQRATTRDVEFGGVTIPARSVVGVWLLSANHDPNVHPAPELVDLHRGVRGGRQLAFGHGIHFCLGTPLARLEARVALEELLQRHPQLTIDHDQLPGALKLHDHTLLAANLATRDSRLKASLRNSAPSSTKNSSGSPNVGQDTSAPSCSSQTSLSATARQAEANRGGRQRIERNHHADEGSWQGPLATAR